jgi:hypothetical protein
MLSESFLVFLVTASALRLSGIAQKISNLMHLRQPITGSTKKTEILPQNDTGVHRIYFLLEEELKSCSCTQQLAGNNKK